MPPSGLHAGARAGKSDQPGRHDDKGEGRCEKDRDKARCGQGLHGTVFEGAPADPDHGFHDDRQHAAFRPKKAAATNPTWVPSSARWAA